MRVLISGGFDPIHVGHVRYIQAARKFGDELVIVVNNDDWLMRKKGKVFMTAFDRAEIARAIGGKNTTSYILHNSDDHVASAIRWWKPDVFAKGGDRDMPTLPREELEACASIGCRIECGVGGLKIRSSSDLLKAYGE